ncbi:MAG: hypothetical protein CBC48_10690 [bacterium TMED88]|nr:MAG: hypothetical protein CBC48_10690 [bacterium TMED88]
MQALAKRLFLAGRFRLPSGFAARGPAFRFAKRAKAHTQTSINRHRSVVPPEYDLTRLWA